MHEEPTDPRERIAVESARIHDRLTSMSAARLDAPIPGHASRAEATYSVARRLALLAQGVEGRHDEHPAHRDLPAVEAHVVADQLAVCVTDLLLAADGLPDDASVPTGVTRGTLGAVLREAADALTDLRRHL